MEPFESGHLNHSKEHFDIRVQSIHYTERDSFSTSFGQVTRIRSAPGHANWVYVVAWCPQENAGHGPINRPGGVGSHLSPRWQDCSIQCVSEQGYPLGYQGHFVREVRLMLCVYVCINRCTSQILTNFDWVGVSLGHGDWYLEHDSLMKSMVQKTNLPTSSHLTHGNDAKTRLYESV